MVSSLTDLIKIINSELLTVEEVNYFIKSVESYLKGSVGIESIYKTYPFLKDMEIEFFKKNFGSLRSSLVSRKKIRIYVPITISKDLTIYLYNFFNRVFKSDVILDPILDGSIVAGIRFTFDGKVFDLSLENIKKT